jgi:hypothetical protein
MRDESIDGKHPVYDFLTTYYSFPLKNLSRWTPGAGVLCAISSETDELFSGRRHFIRSERGWVLPPRSFPERRRTGLQQTLQLLEATATRPGFFGCFGMHEWAMVYRAREIRHSREPLRLSPGEIKQFVESRPICCSHWDAFRFFTNPARPLNSLQPRPDNRAELEQPACLHANMDLYRWSYKFYPWVESSLLVECFVLALEIRELDMRAAPYDLRRYGFEPVRIETAGGRREYERRQREFAARAEPLRERLIAGLRRLMGSAKEPPHAR